MGDGAPKVSDGSRGSFFEEGLEFGEDHLDGIEVGTVGRQEAQLGAARPSFRQPAAHASHPNRRRSPPDQKML